MLEVAKFADALRYVPDVFIEQFVDLTAVGVRHVPEAQQYAHLVERQPAGDGGPGKARHVARAGRGDGGHRLPPLQHHHQ